MPLIKIHLARLLLFPSLLCLDAPFIALGWVICLSQDLGGVGRDAFSPWAGAALFLSVWLIYLFDRLLDVARSDAAVPLTRRHEWARRHRPFLRGLFAGALVYFVFAVIPRLEVRMILGGLALGLFTGLYFLAFRFSRWYARLRREVPLKELIIALCFAGGILLAVSPATFTTALIPLGAGYLTLFAANCLLISRAERGIDRLADPAAYFSADLLDALRARLPGWGALFAVWSGVVTLLLEGQWVRSSLSLILCGLLTGLLARRDADDECLTPPLADGIQLLPWAVLAAEAIGKMLLA